MKNDWVELEDGFYIVEESGKPCPVNYMSKQADQKYQEIKEAFEGKIKFVSEESQ